MAVLLPVSRSRSEQETSSAFDIEVYRDQLAEIEADEKRALIGEAEAAEARAEIGRRILQIGTTENAPADSVGKSGKWLASIAVLLIPLISIMIYSVTGSPGLPAQPLQARLDKSPAENTIEELVARAESHLTENPQDSRGWDVIAPIYVRVRRYADAERAYRNAIHLDGSDARRQSGLGEAILALNHGVVTPEAKAAFEEAIKLEPRNSKARFFLAMAKVQQGKDAEALAAWRAVADDAPDNSPWRQAALNAIAAVEGRSEQTARPGPDAADIAAAENLSVDDRREMIETMVGSLASRLEENPLDEEGWRKLIRSYVVLGRNKDAREALGQGATALNGVPGAARSLRDFASELGVTETE